MSIVYVQFAFNNVACNCEHLDVGRCIIKFYKIKEKWFNDCDVGTKPWSRNMDIIHSGWLSVTHNINEPNYWYTSWYIIIINVNQTHIIGIFFYLYTHYTQ